jgi:hypothetical protein
MKPLRQDVLDPVDFHSHVSRRQPGYFSDRHRVHILEIRNDDLTIEWFELLNQCRQPIQIDAPIGGVLASRHFGKNLEFFQAHQF